MQRAILVEMLRLIDSRTPFAVATVVKASGSVPGKPGAKMILTSDGTKIGTVGGAGLEERVVERCRESIESGKSGLHSFTLWHEAVGGLDSLCGGSVEVHVESVRPIPHLLICGAGHVGREVARLCGPLGFFHSVLDDRPEYASKERFPDAREIHLSRPGEFFSGRDLSTYSHFLLLGYTHSFDLEILRLVLPVFVGYIGVIASAAKKKEMTARLRAAGVDETLLDTVRWPVGLPIGAETPAEIAVSIVAEIIADRADPALCRPAARKDREPGIINSSSS